MYWIRAKHHALRVIASQYANAMVVGNTVLDMRDEQLRAVQDASVDDIVHNTSNAGRGDM